MFVVCFNSKQNRDLHQQNCVKSALPNPKSFLHCLKSPEMTSQKQCLAEILNINIFHITQHFGVKQYQRNQWNLPTIMAYISDIFDDFFPRWVVELFPFK